MPLPYTVSGLPPQKYPAYGGWPLSIHRVYGGWQIAQILYVVGDTVIKLPIIGDVEHMLDAHAYMLKFCVCGPLFL